MPVEIWMQYYFEFMQERQTTESFFKSHIPVLVSLFQRDDYLCFITNHLSIYSLNVSFGTLIEEIMFYMEILLYYR